MKQLIFILAVILFGCDKQIPMPMAPSVTPKIQKMSPVKPAISLVYDVKVILKWAQTAPFQAPVLYDSVKSVGWAVNNLGSPTYGKADTAFHITDWFSTYSNDTVKFCLSENGSGWQNIYTGSIPFRTCEEIFLVNGVVKMDTMLSDMSPMTPPTITVSVK